MKPNANGGINGRPLKLVSEDDQYLTKNTVSGYRKIVNVDKAKIVLVATYGGVFAVKDLAVQDKVVVIDPLDCNMTIANAEKNIFCIATETESIGQSLAKYLISQGKLDVGIMYSTKDQFMSLVTDAFKQVFVAAGGKVTIESFNYDDVDFKTQLTKIKSNNPNALVLLGHDETGVIMKEARDLGIKVPFLTTGTITSPGAQQAAKGYAEGTVFAYWDADSNSGAAKAFVDKFTAMVGRPPILPLTTHPAYDTVNILTKLVLPSIKGDLSDSHIRSALLAVKNYNGITGNITVNSNGAAPIRESVYKLVKGVPVKI